MSFALKAPFPYPGGKSKVAPVVWGYFGRPSYFVEPCVGSGAVLLANPYRCYAETINDADCMLTNFWRAVVKDPVAVAWWANWPINEGDLVARHLWLRTRVPWVRRKILSNPDWSNAKIAGWWVWGLCQWIGSGWCRELNVFIPAWRKFLIKWLGHPGPGYTGPSPLRGFDGISHEQPGGVHAKRPRLDRGGQGVNAAAAVDGGNSRGWPQGVNGGHGRGGMSKHPMGVLVDQPQKVDHRHQGKGVHQRPQKIDIRGTKGINGDGPGRDGWGLWKRPYLSRGGIGVQNRPRNNRNKFAVPRAFEGDLLRVNHGRSAKAMVGGDHLASLAAWFVTLADRLRRVRMLCGDFERVLSEGTTTGRWPMTAVFLDPPYDPKMRRRHLYNEDPVDVAARARRWAIEHGDDPKLRIGLCGLEGEHHMPDDWMHFQWERTNGLGQKQATESIWFSPHCLVPGRDWWLPATKNVARGQQNLFEEVEQGQKPAQAALGAA